MDPDPRAPGESTSRADARPEGAPDWPAAAQFLRRRLRQLLPGSQAADVDDLVQEALIDLVRTCRHEPVRNVDALLNTLARRKAIDMIRRRDRWSALVRPMAGDDSEELDASHWRGTDPAERLSFVVLQFFDRERSACTPLARAYFEGHDWAEVAAKTGLSPAAIRKQWSRCVAHLRRTLVGDADTAWGWTDREQEQDDADR